jgi:hypothetical protein
MEVLEYGAGVWRCWSIEVLEYGGAVVWRCWIDYF